MRWCLLCLCCCTAAGAQDLGEEAVRWGPVPGRPDPYPAEAIPWWMSWEGLWCSDALVWAAPADRLAGLERIDRTTAPVDGQLSLAFLHANPLNFGYDFGEPVYVRPYARLGSDALAPHGSVLGGAGAALGYGFLGSFAGDVGYSTSRHLVLTGDADLFVLHVRGDLDGQRRTTRLGITWRWPGGADGFAFAVTLDRARTLLRSPGSPSVAGLVGEASAQWLLVRHLHVDALVTAGGPTMDATGTRRDGEVSGALGIGVGF